MFTIIIFEQITTNKVICWMLFMAALRSRCRHYIFALGFFFLSIFIFLA